MKWFSDNAETIMPSSILKIANRIRAMKADGQTVYNFTVGDFDGDQFPIPQELKDEMTQALIANKTTYVPSKGLPDLKASVGVYYKNEFGLEVSPEEVLISSGARPLIYTAFLCVLNPGEKVIYGVPSWNNHCYAHLLNAESIVIHTSAETGFLPNPDEIVKNIPQAHLICLNSPLNPSGTCLPEEDLKKICLAVVEENKKRMAANEKPIYLLYDHIYFKLIYGDFNHAHPLKLVPEVKDYCIIIDGLSKNFCATGLRLGWMHAPQRMIDRAADVLGHVGAWAPTPIQVATAKYLRKDKDIKDYTGNIKKKLHHRLLKLHEGIQKLKAEGLPFDSIEPQGALYLSFYVKSKMTNNELCEHLLVNHKIGLIPMDAFGLSEDNARGWFRLSVGSVTDEEIETTLGILPSVV